jgi:hypothetical protein
MLAMIVAMLLAADAPTVKYLGTSSRHGGEWLSFEVENSGKAPIAYAGYTPESYTDGIPAGEIRPFYSIEVRVGNEWKQLELGHCATGRGKVSIDAKSKVRFYSVIPEGDWTETRVGLSWQQGDNQSLRGVAWSDTIKRNDLKLRAP